MRKPPAAKPNSTISASVKTARRRAMRASPTDGRAAASPSAKSSAARSRGVSAPVPASLGSSSSYSPSDPQPDQLLQSERQAAAVLRAAKELPERLEEVRAVPVDSERDVLTHLLHRRPELRVLDLLRGQRSQSSHGSSFRTTGALAEWTLCVPHEQTSQTVSPSRPPSSSPQRRCSCKKASRAARSAAMGGRIARETSPRGQPLPVSHLRHGAFLLTRGPSTKRPTDPAPQRTLGILRLADSGLPSGRLCLQANRPLEFHLCRIFTLGEESSYRGRRGGG